MGDVCLDVVLKWMNIYSPEKETWLFKKTVDGMTMWDEARLGL